MHQEQAARVDRRRATVTYYGLIVAYYGLAVVVSLGLVRAFGGLATVVQLIGMTVVTVRMFMYEEDWWDDFRDQHRAIRLGMLGNAAAVGAGFWLASL
jgi:hypothetical protein